MKERPLKNIKSIKYLGISIDKKLRFVEDTAHVEQKLIQFNELFCKLRKKLIRKQLITIFNTFLNQ